MKYTALLFKQNSQSPPQLLFVTTTAEIDDWAKVPTRMTSRPEGFQRTEVKGHVEDLKEFFDKDTSHSNSSPTSLLIGFDPAFQKMIKVIAEDGSVIDLTDVSAVPKAPRVVTLEINFTPWDGSVYAADDAEIDALFADLVQTGILRTVSAESEGDAAYPSPAVDQDGDTTTGRINPSALESAEAEDESSEITIDENGDDDDDSADGVETTSVAASEAVVGTEALTVVEALAARAGEQQERLASTSFDSTSIPLHSIAKLRAAWTEQAIKPEFRGQVRSLLKNERKPGIIIDGQHRVKATRDADYPFSVCFLPTSPWEELAFQFIVNNHTARKVDENLLTAIVGQSLDDKQLEKIEARLSRAGIKVQLIKAATRVQVEDNPFRGMLMTGTEGESGFLRSTAMQSNVIKLWYGDQSKRGKNSGNPNLASFQLLAEDTYALHKFSMQKLFLVNCDGRRVMDRKQTWQKDIWFPYFRAFWSAVKQVYQPSGIWPDTQAKWPVPDRKHGADQLRVGRFMRTTLLGPFQLAVMQRWAEKRLDNSDSDMTAMAKKKITPEQFHGEIVAILEPLTSDFFSSLKASGFQGSTSVRDNIKQMLWQILKRTKSVAEIKANELYKQYFD
jgi:hypothetical protein